MSAEPNRESDGQQTLNTETEGYGLNVLLVLIITRIDQEQERFRRGKVTALGGVHPKVSTEERSA